MKNLPRIKKNGFYISYLSQIIIFVLMFSLFCLLVLIFSDEKIINV